MTEIILISCAFILGGIFVIILSNFMGELTNDALLL